jgi:Predicted transcriptional regulators
LQNSEIQDADVLKALASEKRLSILEWLKSPRLHFPPQVDGELEEDGVCGALLASKLGVSQATLSEHMRVLVQAELVTARRIKQWVFYRRNEARLDELKRGLFTKL